MCVSVFALSPDGSRDILVYQFLKLPRTSLHHEGSGFVLK